MADTHCLPSGLLVPGQLPVSPVSDQTRTVTPSTHAPVGGKTTRAAMIFLHASQASAPPLPLPVTSGIGVTYTGLQAAANADGYYFDFPAYPVDWPTTQPAGAPTPGAPAGYFGNIWCDVLTDPGHGARVVETLGRWMDHEVRKVWADTAEGIPIVLAGFSLGAWAAIQLAITGSPTGMDWNLVGFIAHAPATIWENVYGFGNWPGAPASGAPPAAALNFSGMDLSTTALNGVTIPGIVGGSNTDATVGWTNNPSQTSPMPWELLTITGVNMTGGQSFMVSSNFPGGVSGGMLATVTSGAGVLAAGTVTYTGTGTFMGVVPDVVTSGTGCTVTFGGPLSNSWAMVQNARAAGRNITWYSNASSTIGGDTVGYPNGHLFLSGSPTPSLDGLEYFDWLQSTIDPLCPIAF